MPRPSIHFGAAAILIPATAALLAVTAPPAVSAEDSVYSMYLTLVERSCSERDVALRALSRWPPWALEEAAPKLIDCDPCEPAPPWAAAAMLHTMQALAAGPGSVSRLHLELAARLQQKVRDETFRRRWSLAAGLGCLHQVELEMARSFLEQGLEAVEDDPDLLVALGATYEVEAQRMRLSVRSLGPERPHHTKERQERRAKRSDCWTNAADLYEKALARDPEHPEAHLRLGRVELLRGHEDRGLAELRWVEEHADEPDLVYLAYLLIGREQKRSGQLDAALASYRAALEAEPLGQAACVATSHALHMRGDSRAAAEVLERGLAARRHRRARDAWWRYPGGRPNQLEDLLTGLHEDGCR